MRGQRFTGKSFARSQGVSDRNRHDYMNARFGPSPSCEDRDVIVSATLVDVRPDKNGVLGSVPRAIAIGCGRCAPCLRHRVSALVGRAMAEAGACDQVYSLTLTNADWSKVRQPLAAFDAGIADLRRERERVKRRYLRAWHKAQALGLPAPLMPELDPLPSAVGRRVRRLIDTAVTEDVGFDNPEKFSLFIDQLRKRHMRAAIALGFGSSDPDLAAQYAALCRSYGVSDGEPSIKYMIAGEYGSKGGRYHNHVLLFVIGLPVDFDFRKGLQSLDRDDRLPGPFHPNAKTKREAFGFYRAWIGAWPYGFVQFEILKGHGKREVDVRAVEYACKYAYKGQIWAKEGGQEKPVRRPTFRMSTRPMIGSVLIERIAQQLHVLGGVPIHFKYTLPDVWTTKLDPATFKVRLEPRQFTYDGALRVRILSRWLELSDKPWFSHIGEGIARMGAPEPVRKRGIRPDGSVGWVETKPRESLFKPNVQASIVKAERIRAERAERAAVRAEYEARGGIPPEFDPEAFAEGAARWKRPSWSYETHGMREGRRARDRARRHEEVIRQADAPERRMKRWRDAPSADDLHDAAVREYLNGDGDFRSEPRPEVPLVPF